MALVSVDTFYSPGKLVHCNQSLITTEKTIIFVMLLFHKGYRNFPRIIREIDHNLRDVGSMLLSLSCAIGSSLLSDTLTVEEVNRKFQLPS